MDFLMITISVVIILFITIILVYIFSKVKLDWDKIIDTIQAGMMFLLILVVAVCIVTLIAFDGVVGAGSMMVLTNNNLRASIGISLATSGLLMSLMFVAYSLTSAHKSKLIDAVGSSILMFAGLIYILDIYFDSLTADYLRFGGFVALKDLATVNLKVTHVLFRLLIGGLSTVGETLAVAIILGLPVLKSLFAENISKSKERFEPKPNHQRPNAHKPQHRPDFKRHDDQRNQSTYHSAGMKNLLDEIMKEEKRK